MTKQTIRQDLYCDWVDRLSCCDTIGEAIEYIKSIGNDATRVQFEHYMGYGDDVESTVIALREETDEEEREREAFEKAEKAAVKKAADDKKQAEMDRIARQIEMNSTRDMALWAFSQQYQYHKHYNNMYNLYTAILRSEYEGKSATELTDLREFLEKLKEDV